ncbi:ComF family protein [Rhodobacteraceae bacterium CCMM004]|nr:ComF family protein [Rhodobacteraceae bacterium CCMM004]
MGRMQTALRLIYPDQCLACEALVEGGQGLCGACWRETPFVLGLACDTCGAPLPGVPGEVAQCDDCLARPRPWRRGRTTLVYDGRARRLALALKHGDRADIVAPAAAWMRRAGRDLLHPGQILLPVPLHWTRLLRRRYNQAALLAQEIARLTGQPYAPRALIRRRRTPPQKGADAEARFANLADAIAPHPVHGAVLDGADVLLIDDVMTSGATLAASALAAASAGAARVDTLTLARAVRAP